MKAVNQGYLPTLDGWRAIAILAVLLDHATLGAWGESHPKLLALTRTGPNGVSLFFAISGFLICSRLLEEEDLTGRISLRGFYLRRAFRILPAAIIYLAVIAVLGLTRLIYVSLWDWWSALLFFRNYLPTHMIGRGWGGYTVHYWSLAVEEHFYLLWPALLAFSGRIRARYLAAGMAMGIAIWRWWDFQHQWIDRHIPGLIFGSRTDVRLDALLIGCFAALILAEPRWRSWTIRNLKTWIWWLCVAGYVLIQVLSHHHYYTLWESTLLAVIVVGTVLQPGTWVGRLLEQPLLRWIGRLSYSLYLWQQFYAWPQEGSLLHALQRFPQNLLLLFATAALSYRFIERPMIRLGHRLAPPPTEGRQDLRASLVASEISTTRHYRTVA